MKHPRTFHRQIAQLRRLGARPAWSWRGALRRLSARARRTALVLIALVLAIGAVGLVSGREDIARPGDATAPSTELARRLAEARRYRAELEVQEGAPPNYLAVEGRDAPGAPPMRASFGLCHTGGGTNCVVDGDTFWIGGEKVRIADIDAPETHPPRCAEEARLGAAATMRLQALLNAGPVTLATAGRDTDRYGRKLRVVMRGGVSLGDMLVSEGLARPWEGRRRAWC